MGCTIPSPKKQPTAIQTGNTTMTSHQSAPKQILKKQQISKAEYRLRQEWDPENVDDYQVSSVGPAFATQVQQQAQQQEQQQERLTVNPANVQSRMPNRRSQARSSSLFEEWKAQALRSPDKARGSSPVRAQGNSKGNERTTAPAEAQVSSAENPGQEANNQVEAKPANRGCDQQPEATKATSVSTEPQPLASSVNNINSPVKVSVGTTTKKKTHKRGRASTRQSDKESPQLSQERPQHPSERAPTPAAYTAPNGIQFTKDELRKLALGIRLEDGLKVFFLPCFIDDPWKGLKPVPSNVS
ncbi:hypothetical protein BJX70DRAFT_131692 [Aspergillus crustosus]